MVKINAEKIAEQCWLQFSKNYPKLVNNHPIGKNSPNLVTLIRFAAQDLFRHWSQSYDFYIYNFDFYIYNSNASVVIG
jgi:hypothetical protein